MKQIFISLLIFVMMGSMYAQSTNCQLMAVPNYSATVTCNATITVSGVAALRYYSIDPPGYNDLCPGAQLSVQVQFYIGGVWQNVGNSITVNNGGAWSRNVSATGAYRVIASVVNAGSFCNCSANYTSSTTNLTFQTGPNASFKIDGVTVNPSTYTQFYACNDTSKVRMTNITWSGTNQNYQWQVEVVRTSDGYVRNTPWNNGTPPSTFYLRSFIQVNFGSVPGQYTVRLKVKNVCNASGVTYTGLIQINGIPNTCVQIATNSGCSSFANLGQTASNPTSVCYTAGPRINATCSAGDWLGGYYSVLALEFDANNLYVKTVVATGNIALNNINDLQCLDLNYISSPPLYFYNNHPAGHKWAVLLTLGNTCGSSSAGGYFITNNGGCKTDGEDEYVATDEPVIEELNEPVVFPNPTNSELYIMNYPIPNDLTTIKMYTTDGRLVNADTQVIGEGLLKIDVSALEKGVYIVELNGENKFVKRVIIQ